MTGRSCGYFFVAIFFNPIKYVFFFFFLVYHNVHNGTLVFNPQYASSSLKKWPQTSAVLLKAKTPLCQTVPLRHQHVLPSLAPNQVWNLFPCRCWHSLLPWASTFAGLRGGDPWEAALCICQRQGRRLWLIGRTLMGGCPWRGWGGVGWGGCRRTRTHRGPQHLAITARDCTMSVRKYCTRHPFCFNCHPSSSFGQLWSGRRLLLPDITELLSFAAWHSLLVAVVESVHCGILCSQVISGQHGSRLSSAQTTGSGMWCVVNVPTLDFHNSYFWICCFHMLIYFMK